MSLWNMNFQILIFRIFNKLRTTSHTYTTNSVANTNAHIVYKRIQEKAEYFNITNGTQINYASKSKNVSYATRRLRTSINQVVNFVVITNNKTAQLLYIKKLYCKFKT